MIRITIASQAMVQCRLERHEPRAFNGFVLSSFRTCDSSDSYLGAVGSLRNCGTWLGLPTVLDGGQVRPREKHTGKIRKVLAELHTRTPADLHWKFVRASFILLPALPRQAAATSLSANQWELPARDTATRHTQN